MPCIPILDLFAGPGGLGEGFSAFRQNRESVFKIALSIEADSVAHRTLELRAFFRQFPYRHAPEKYYKYLAGGIARDELFARYPVEAKRASDEAWHATLGDNKFPPNVVDDRIRKAIGNSKRWVLIGGPPCQAYSLVGRSKIIGEKGIKNYEADHRHFLYREYLRIIAEHRPPVFVMENVKGLLSARVNNEDMISRILRDLQHPIEAFGLGAHRTHERLSYRLVSLTMPTGNLLDEIDPGELIVRAEDHGVPQARHRLILLGVADEASVPRLLKTQPRISIDEVIGDLPRLRSGLSREPDSAEAWCSALLTIRESAWLHDSKVDNKLRREILSQLRDVNCELPRGAEWMRPTRRTLRTHHDWFIDNRLDGVCNHATRSHIRKDLHRYFFVAAFARIHGRSPLLNDFPKALLPNHENVAAALKVTKFNDRFRVQVAGRPATTITSHISKDGHYFVHYDPTQCRSLTVREAARLQTFPDKYFFEGPRTQQYHQVGNAVPPLLSHQIAKIVAGFLM